MDARFTDEQDEIRRTLRELLGKRCGPEELRAAVDTPAGHDPALWTTLAEQLGLPGLSLPETYGGVGCTATELALACEETGRTLAPTPLLATVVLAALTAAAAVPLGTKAIDHVNEKIDAAKLSGETVTVWLLDGTTSIYLGIILAVLLLAGVLCEVLPTAKWGRTLGKKLMGLEVRDIEAHDSPEFGAALRRWLVYSVPGLLVVGIVGVAWCLFDRPWRQCWHDKAAHTFVAG
ncbi:RDD family protein [Streptomyces sp. NRRL S-146]|uniref:RDD family protein n=1 Tax=Streptomyces sp. NRRL S-146 TaxID=1463884 RepID=UPI0004CB06B7|nr:RDD family protein [Streptomyces sp. NRRL S-146]